MEYIYKNWISPILNGVSFRRRVDPSTRARPCLRVDTIHTHEDLACWCGCHPQEVNEIHRQKSNSALIQLFQMSDSESTGKLNAKQLRDLLRILGYNPSEIQIAVMISKVDVDANETLDIGEFIHFMNMFVSYRDSANELKEVFRVLDPTGRGVIPLFKLRHYFPDDIYQTLRGKHEDKELSFKEFYEIVTQEHASLK
ncbi:unnamed protein product [Lepeophtheirus salmonis]|nr:unnamed protein product [Lepeophtheirus salmonis]CAF2809495.1 unnamed protein product [Lepeophtheirus salmonis]